MPMHLKQILLKIGKVPSMLVVTLVYILVGAPVFLLMALFRHNPLHAKLNDGSYWQDRKQREQSLDTHQTQY